MKITKFGHCCLLIEEKGLRILTDPGNYSVSQNEARNVDVILITHEHADHLHVDSLRAVLRNNPSAAIMTNRGVGRILDKEKLAYSILEHAEKTMIKNVAIEGQGSDHALIHPELPPVQNTGYFIGERLFYPGDALYNPRRNVDILALPVSAPWLLIRESIEYAKEIHPRICFPVHDGMLKIFGAAHSLPLKILSPLNIQFRILKENSLAVID